MKFGSEPMPVVHLGRLVCRTAATERIKHQISRVCRYKYRAFGDNKLQLIHAVSDLEFLMSVGRGVLPKIGQIQPFRIQLVTVTAIILDLAPTVTACGNGQSDFIECLGIASGKIKQGIVGRVEFLPSWESPFHRERDPMAKGKTLAHVGTKTERKFRKRI